jgi:hypothetical protein
MAASAAAQAHMPYAAGGSVQRGRAVPAASKRPTIRSLSYIWTVPVRPSVVQHLRAEPEMAVGGGQRGTRVAVVTRSRTGSAIAAGHGSTQVAEDYVLSRRAS